MSVLVYADSANGKIHKNGFETVSYGKKIADELGTDVIALVCGNANEAANLGKYGASKVLQATDDVFSSFNPEIISKAVVNAAKANDVKVIIFAHDFSGKSVAPRVAAAMKAGHVSGAVDFPDMGDGFVVKKAVFSGKAFAGVQINSEVKVISLLPNSIEVSENGSDASVDSFDAGISGVESRLKVKEVKKESTELSLTEAELVVSAGRGLKGPENWGMIDELANELGAATACSRPVADIGWRPHHEHVGQTGIAIRPNLYIAIGISGAIQHLAGVNGSKTIVVINIDPEAPFFKAADYGIVGDAFEVVPKLIESVKSFKASNN